MPDWSPWIEHDGGSPFGPLPRICRLEIRFDDHGITIADGSELDGSEPNWFWRKKLSRFLFWSWSHRVCDDAAYAPIISYRYLRPAAMALYGSVETLPCKMGCGPERRLSDAEARAMIEDARI